MKRLMVMVVVVLEGVVISAAPVVGRSVTAGLRVRSQPGLGAQVITSLAAAEEVLVLARGGKTETIDGRSAYWLTVVGIEGRIGWVFGGYLSIGKTQPDSLPVDSGEERQVTSEDYSEPYGNGTMTFVTVTGKPVQGTTDLSDVGAMFYKTAKAAPRIACALPLGFDYEQKMSCTLKQVDFSDLLGDPRKEICLTLGQGWVDGGQTALCIYGMADGSDRYRLFGSIILSEASSGGGCGYEGSRLTSGPAPLAEGKLRMIHVVRESTRFTDQCVKVVMTMEEVYQLVGEDLRLVVTKELESPPGLPMGAVEAEER
jgi:hypothetical protein